MAVDSPELRGLSGVTASDVDRYFREVEISVMCGAPVVRVMIVPLDGGRRRLGLTGRSVGRVSRS
ncbi:hypothetical protein, partial [Halorubrum sp. SD626R]|uniref:hypothetical protein n=1 Tax=Halorubrum sp. SD626R TaxID=1419722 RepID=UPI001A7EA187